MAASERKAKLDIRVSGERAFTVPHFTVPMLPNQPTGASTMSFKTLAAAAFAASLSTAASAAVVTTYYEGTVLLDDRTNVFGTLPAFDLPFFAALAFDTTIGRTTIGDEDRVGGFGIGPASPFVSAALTINGVTYTFGSVGSSSFQVLTGEYVGHTLFYQETDGVGQDRDDVFILTAGSSLTPASIDTAFDLTQEYGYFAPSFQIALWDNDLGVDLEYGSGSFTVTRAYTAAAAVPEPATWAFMILGFGAAGAILRRRLGPVLA